MWTTLAALTLVAAACGDSGGGGGEEAEEVTPEQRQAMIDLVAGNVSGEGEGDDGALPFDDAGSRCFAEHIVDDLGVARLREFGYNTERGTVPPTVIFKASLTEGEKSRAYTALERCVDLQAVVSDFLQAGASWPPEQADCVAADYLETGLLQRSLFTTGTDLLLNQRINEALTEARESCGVEAGEGGEAATTTTAAP